MFIIIVVVVIILECIEKAKHWKKQN